MDVQNIKVEAMKVFYGEDVAQIEKITISPAITKASLAGKYIQLYALVGGAIVKNLFWFDTTGSDVAPVLADSSINKVDISSGAIDTAAEYATTLAAKIALVVGSYASAVATDNTVEVEHANVGYAPAGHDAKQTNKQTQFGMQVLVQGDEELDLGCLEGDIELASEVSFIEVKCHAEGVTPVAQLKNGVSNVEVTLNLEETSPENLKKMFVKAGGSFIPDNGSEVYGMGTYKNFENMFKYAAKLRLHPARLLDGDASEDWNFHKSFPNLKGISWSGEKVLTLPVTFKVFPDDTKDSRVNYFSIGDGSQNLA